MSSKLGMVIDKLRQLQEEIPGLKEQGVNYRQTAEFSRWKDGLGKWLQLGLPYTQGELGKIESLSYCVRRLRLGAGGFDRDDDVAYQKDLDRTHNLIGSAIESIELELVLEQPTETPTAERGEKREEPRTVSVGEAETVIIGDRNVISIVDSITVADFLNIIEKEIEKQVEDEEIKRGLLQKLKDISEHPMVTAIIGQALGDVLRANF